MTIPPQPPGDPGAPYLVLLDQVDVSETFAHSLRRWSVDGVNLHLEFAVNRWADPDPAQPDRPVMKIVTVARLVLPLGAVPELQKALTGVMRNLHQESPVKPTVEGPNTIQ